MKKIVLFVILYGLLIACVHLRAEDSPEMAVQTSSVFTMTVVPPQEPIVTGQIIGLTLKIRNVSTKAVNLPWPGYINQFITTESSEGPDSTVLMIKHKGGSLGHGEYPGGDLAPSAEMTVTVWHIFPTSGTYSLKCILEISRRKTLWWSFWEGHVESNTIRIHVKEKKDGEQ